MTTPEEIIQIVMRYFKVPEEEVMSTCRRGELVQTRQVSMYFISKLTGYSHGKIKTYFPGIKNRVTVLHAIRCVKNEMEMNKYFKSKIDSIELLMPAGNKVKADDSTELIITEYRKLKFENQQLKREISNLRETIYELKLKKSFKLQTL
jgi:hypothetical protein